MVTQQMRNRAEIWMQAMHLSSESLYDSVSYIKNKQVNEQKWEKILHFFNEPFILSLENTFYLIWHFNYTLFVVNYMIILKGFYFILASSMLFSLIPIRIKWNIKIRNHSIYNRILVIIEFSKIYQV